jgi:nucleoside 2-deoxyribosyltransferase
MNNLSFFVYCAGPITWLSYNETVDWRNDLKKMLPPNIKILSPMRGKDHLKREKEIHVWQEGNPLCSKKGIVTRDRFDVSRCDLFLANLFLSEKVSIGTMVEFGWADAYRKPIVTIMREEGIYRHPFILELSSFITENIEEAAEVIKSILLP